MRISFRSRPTMIVCVCHRVSDQHIAREVRSGCDSFDELQADLRVGTACGACTDCARETFEGAQHEHRASQRSYPTFALVPA
jgi:bacterioferritin-associated ferredoxin